MKGRLTMFWRVFLVRFLVPIKRTERVYIIRVLFAKLAYCSPWEGRHLVHSLWRRKRSWATINHMRITIMMFSVAIDRQKCNNFVDSPPMQWAAPTTRHSPLHLSEPAPQSLGFPFLRHRMKEVWTSSYKKINPPWKWKIFGQPLIGQPYPLRKWKFSDLSQFFTILQISDSKFPFVKQLWGHRKACNFTRDQNHSSNKCNQPLILIKMKCK